MLLYPPSHLPSRPKNSNIAQHIKLMQSHILHSCRPLQSGDIYSDNKLTFFLMNFIGGFPFSPCVSETELLPYCWLKVRSIPIV